MGKLPDDPRFRHVSYHATDVRRTWARERARLKAETERKAAEAEAAQATAHDIEAEAQRKVRTIRGAK